MDQTTTQSPRFVSALVSGAIAGMSVDLTLYPLDTLKTRLQSEVGFTSSGGFSKLYRGLGSAMIVSAPNAAVFFMSYEAFRKYASPKVKEPIITNIMAATIAETAACLIRVPVEVIKQRAQASKISQSEILKRTLKEEKFTGFYRGFLSTISRDIPFAVIQLPLWEYLKTRWSSLSGEPLAAWQSCFCGSLAGLFAALATNPIDVAKTRIMLAYKDNQKYAKYNFFSVIRTICKESGLKGLYSGATPRITFITIGGAVYLGGYDLSRKTIDDLID